jgi:hypothetical protein
MGEALLLNGGFAGEGGEPVDASLAIKGARPSNSGCDWGEIISRVILSRDYALHSIVEVVVGDSELLRRSDTQIDFAVLPQAGSRGLDVDLIPELSAPKHPEALTRPYTYIPGTPGDGPFAIMGVPFEALLPYGIMMVVSPTPPSPQSRTTVTRAPLDVRNHWRHPLQTQKHAKRRKARTAFN